MGFIKIAKEEISTSLAGNEKAYKPIIDIINKKDPQLQYDPDIMNSILDFLIHYFVEILICEAKFSFGSESNWSMIEGCDVDEVNPETEPMRVKHPKKVQERGNFSMKILSPRVRSKYEKKRSMSRMRFK
uniref:Uncharacterized protein n=1 Tax=Lactuca sativa TaxID=4236 RepID=A0A9R1WC42_LACSA|nr:hypothetical protein LSAT_V11C200054040 [Lactuca sativa]